MSDFEDRGKAFEKKFEMDEEKEFKASSRAAKQFGLWIAHQLGMEGAEAENYAGKAVELVIKSRDELLNLASKDLQEKGLEVSRHRLEKEMNILYTAARKQISA
ncbi:MAG: ATPase inhibitor subunit zeta [Alphaproteobacteria bacterium]